MSTTIILENPIQSPTIFLKEEEVIIEMKSVKILKR